MNNISVHIYYENSIENGWSKLKIDQIDGSEFLVLITSKAKQKITYLYGSVEREKLQKYDEYFVNWRVNFIMREKLNNI